MIIRTRRFTHILIWGTEIVAFACFGLPLDNFIIYAWQVRDFFYELMLQLCCYYVILAYKFYIGLN